MSRETENALLLSVGLSTAMITVTGTYTRYVKPSLLPWLAVAAALLIALALSSIVANNPHPTRHGDDHGHANRSGIVWLLAVPVVIMAFVVPPALAARAVAPSVVAVSAKVLRHPFPPLPAQRAPEVSLKEVRQRVASDTAGTLDGRVITVTGFTLKEANATDLARVGIICCAADAQLARVHLGGAAATTAATYPEDTWLRVEGQIAPHPPDPAARSVPTLTISNVTRIDPPANPYDY